MLLWDLPWLVFGHLERKAGRWQRRLERSHPRECAAEAASWVQRRSEHQGRGEKHVATRHTTPGGSLRISLHAGAVIPSRTCGLGVGCPGRLGAGGQPSSAAGTAPHSEPGLPQRGSTELQIQPGTSLSKMALSPPALDRVSFRCGPGLGRHRVTAEPTEVGIKYREPESQCVVELRRHVCQTERDVAARRAAPQSEPGTLPTPGWKDGDERRTPPLLPSNPVAASGAAHAKPPAQAPQTLPDFNSWGRRPAGLARPHRACAPGPAPLPCPPAARQGPGFPAVTGTGLHVAAGGVSWEASGSSFHFCHLVAFQEGFPFVPPLTRDGAGGFQPREQVDTGQLPAPAALLGGGPESQELRCSYTSTSSGEAAVVLTSQGPQLCFYVLFGALLYCKNHEMVPEQRRESWPWSTAACSPQGCP